MTIRASNLEGAYSQARKYRRNVYENYVNTWREVNGDFQWYLQDLTCNILQHREVQCKVHENYSSKREKTMLGNFLQIFRYTYVKIIIPMIYVEGYTW